MRNLSNLFLLLALLLLIMPAVAKTTEPPFQVGDWFECEMEFIHDVPIFHNHWANNDSVDLIQQYLSVKFVMTQNSFDSVEIWDYEIVRYRLLHGIYPAKDNNYQRNAHCLDIWCPEYFTDNFDSVRQSFKGSITLANNSIKEHSLKYDPSQLTKKMGATSIFPIHSERDTYGVSKITGGGGALNTKVEQLFSLIYFTKNITHNRKALLNLFKIEHVEFEESDSVSFSINDKDFSNNYTAYLLPNGLAYSFKDKYNQKVMAITNASFDLPNMAVVTINDKRSTTEERKKYFDNIVIQFGNPAHVISQKIKTNQTVSNYTFELKSGVEMILSNYTLPRQYIFVEPGDSIQINIQDDENTPLIISGSYNNTEYHKLAIGTDAQIMASTLSPECKAYLTLKNKIHSTYQDLETASNMKDYQRAMVDFYFLKSFHYKGLFEFDNVLTVIGMGNLEQHKKMQASGAPFRRDFKFKYYNAISNFSHFSLYAELYSMLKGAIVLDRKSYYDEFFKNCGDTLVTNKLASSLNGVKSVQVGMNLPFLKLLTEHNQEVDILPKKGNFGLLFLYVITNDLKSLGNIFLSELPDNVQYVSYQMNRDKQVKSFAKITETSLSKANSLELFGHPSMTDSLNNLLYGSNVSVMILYDDKGEIVYNSPYNPNNEKQILEIKEAIQKAKSKPISKSMTLLLIILASVGGTILLSYIIYRIRLAGLNKKNAREQLIQELKLKSVQSQLNPHFLFNALNSIQVLVKSGNTQKADKYLVGFSELLRSVLQNADKRLVPLSEELKMVNRYCELEKLRLDFDCELKTDTQTNLDLIEVPYMLLQPIIENAIKHGVVKANERGMLKIEITETNSVIHICVTDNGSGFDGVPLEVMKEKGRGLKLSLEKLQSIYGADADFQFLAANPGTTVSIKLKIG